MSIFFTEFKLAAILAFEATTENNVIRRFDVIKSVIVEHVTASTVIAQLYGVAHYIIWSFVHHQSW